MKALLLGVNIDHVATLRQARYATMPDSKNAEPDPIAIAGICERVGAHSITADLRATFQHRDLERLRESIVTKLNPLRWGCPMGQCCCNSCQSI